MGGTEPLRPRKGSHPRTRRAHVPQALALKHEAEFGYSGYSARRRSSLAGAPTAPPVVYSFLPSASPGAGWTISPASSVSPTTPAPISLFASTAAVSPAVYARRPSAPRVRRADGDATRPSLEYNRLHFPLPPSSSPLLRPRMSLSRPAPVSIHPLSPTPAPVRPRPRQSHPPLPVRSSTLEDTQMYDELKTFVFGAASVSHDLDMDDGASDAASAYNPLSPALRPDGAFAARRPSKSAPRRPSRANLRDGAVAASGKRRNSRAWIPSDSTVARPEIAVTSIPRDQDLDADDEDHDGLIRMMERAKMRAIDDGARRPSLPINIPDSVPRRGSRDTTSANKPLPDTPSRRPSGALATAGFDLDYILAGPASFPQANPSGQGIAQTTAGLPMSWDSYQQQQQQQSRRNSAIAPFASGHEMQTLDVEDTFLSMVRQLDTEYARRRNKWSFRQEPRRAYDYDLDPDEEVWACEPVGTCWVGKDREAMHTEAGPKPVIIKPLQPQVSPKSQTTPQERRADIRVCRDEKRPMWKLSVLPAGSQSTIPVKIMLATKAMHLKVASAPLRSEGRRRGHTVHADSFEMNSSSGELGPIDELTHPKTSHAVAFDTLTDAELDHAGRRHITFSERIRRAFGSESPPPTHAQPTFSPPWLMMAPQSAKEEQIRQIRELHSAFRAVGLLTPPKPGGKDPNQPHAIKAVRTPDEKPAHHETPASIIEDIPADALCMTIPLWQFRGSSTKDKDEELGLTSVGVPVSEREYLLVYFVPLGAADAPTPAPASRLSKKRSRGNLDRRSSNSISAAASWAKGRRTAFHVVARVLPLPNSSRPDCATQARSRRPASPRPLLAARPIANEGRFRGLDRLGLCTPSYEWQSEAERFPGLTPVGVEVVEMVWAGCVAVLGIGA
ncbi:hypothetical protein RhiXN_06636 [Rhizoctonia solani]|uniref:Uncharacterized protein n=1 Tax=Rhizoctonia solani TaxID=456999 RepID=A0A8H8P0W2_9AGAM|nr:uncharacterized protein RhiXN_06636 [Rhizoctonia solani]QRW21647.1 hypothetical protein RhiXN_06636 [Rhizoctonia solani]